MPRCQQRNKSRRRRASSPSLEICVPNDRLSNAKNPDGPGGGYIDRGGPLCTGPHCACPARASQHAAHAPGPAQPPVCLAHQPARHRAAAGEALRPAARARGAARHRPVVPPALRRHRPPRAAQAQRGAGRPTGDGRGHGRGTSPRPTPPRARALPHRHQRRHRPHADADFFQRPPGLSGKAAAARRDALRLRHRPVLRRHAADGASRPGGGRGRLCRPAAGRAELSAHRGARARQCAARDGRRARRAGAHPGAAGMAGRGLGVARALCRLLPMLWPICTGRTSRTTFCRRSLPGRGSLTTNCSPANWHWRWYARICAASPAAARQARASCARAS